jgi:ATP-dependent Zn protease
LLIGVGHRRLSDVRLAEAKALIIRHRDAVLAIANALMIHRTLDAVMIHEIIARARLSRRLGSRST